MSANKCQTDTKEKKEKIEKIIHIIKTFLHNDEIQKNHEETKYKLERIDKSSIQKETIEPAAQTACADRKFNV